MTGANRSPDSGMEVNRSAQNNVKIVQSVGKVMVSDFGDLLGVVLIEYLEKDKTISGEYYVEHCWSN